MKKIFLLLFILFTSRSIINSHNNDSIINLPYPMLNTTEDKLYGLSTLWSEVKYNFVNIDQLDFDIDSLYKSTISKVLGTKNDIEYYDELQRFMAIFNDGHTEIISTPYDWNEYNDYIPVSLESIERKIYITAVKKNAGLDSTLLGSEVIEIESFPTEEYIKKTIYPFISASTEEHRWFQAIYKIVGGQKGSYLNGKAKKVNGAIVDFSIQRNGETTRTPHDEYWQWASSKIRKPRNSPVTLEWDGNIAILDIRQFWPESINQLIDSLAIQINKRAEGLIIDLRYNRGGSTEVAEHLQKYLTRKKSFLTFGSQFRINNGYGRSQGNYREEYADFYRGKAYETNKPDSIIVDDSIKPFKCPVAVLIGIYTFSAAEDFLVNIYETEGRPLLIGESTGGSTGAPLVIELPHELIARICTLRILFPYSGKPFVQEGIQPDILIRQNVTDYINGKDVVLEKAIKELKMIPYIMQVPNMLSFE